MEKLATTLFCASIAGLGATLTFDLCAQLLKHAFKIEPSNIRLVGRWILYMRSGVFTHSSIASAPPKPSECAVGWIAHYGIGVMLALVFIAWVGSTWLQQPRPVPALVFGVISVAAPFCIMQPSFGLGFAASKTPHPGLARFRSLMNHLAYGGGLYIFAVAIQWLISI